MSTRWRQKAGILFSGGYDISSGNGHTTRVDQTNRSTLVKLILFEKSRVELELLVTTVTEVSPPFLGVPQIWRSRSGYKSIAVSFCDQLVCSRLLATQTRTSARDPVVSARGVRSELAEGGSSAPLWYVAAGPPRRFLGASTGFSGRIRPFSAAHH